jgi:hypothetical protein
MPASDQRRLLYSSPGLCSGGGQTQGRFGQPQGPRGSQVEGSGYADQPPAKFTFHQMVQSVNAAVQPSIYELGIVIAPRAPEN